MPIPFIKGCGRNSDAPMADALAEKRFLHGRLTSGIEYQFSAKILMYGKAPSEPGAGYFAVRGKEDRGFLRGMYVCASDSPQGSGRFSVHFFLSLSYKLLNLFRCFI